MPPALHVLTEPKGRSLHDPHQRAIQNGRLRRSRVMQVDSDAEVLRPAWRIGGYELKP
jgi:hypothetical protein